MFEYILEFYSSNYFQVTVCYHRSTLIESLWYLFISSSHPETVPDSDITLGPQCHLPAQFIKSLFIIIMCFQTSILSNMFEKLSFEHLSSHLSSFVKMSFGKFPSSVTFIRFIQFCVISTSFIRTLLRIFSCFLERLVRQKTIEWKAEHVNDMIAWQHQ